MGRVRLETLRALALPAALAGSAQVRDQTISLPIPCLDGRTDGWMDGWKKIYGLHFIPLHATPAQSTPLHTIPSTPLPSKERWMDGWTDNGSMSHSMERVLTHSSLKAPIEHIPVFSHGRTFPALFSKVVFGSC